MINDPTKGLHYQTLGIGKHLFNLEKNMTKSMFAV